MDFRPRLADFSLVQVKDGNIENDRQPELAAVGVGGHGVSGREALGQIANRWRRPIFLVGGQIVTWAFLWAARRWLGATEITDKSLVPGWVTGIVERLFVAFLVFDQANGIPAGMMAWLALKFVTNWNHRSSEVEGILPERVQERLNVRTNASLALLAGLISLGFAYWGGIVCRPDSKEAEHRDQKCKTVIARAANQTCSADGCEVRMRYERHWNHKQWRGCSPRWDYVPGGNEGRSDSARTDSEGRHVSGSTAPAAG